MKHWCWLPLLISSLCWGIPLVRVGVYPYAPFVIKEAEGQYRGLTPDLVALLNEVQQEVRFVLVPTSAAHRHEAMALGRFSLMLFEEQRWNWHPDQVLMTYPLLLGGEVYVALRAPGREQRFFQPLSRRQLIGVAGHHYGFARFDADQAELRERFNITLLKDNISALQGLFKGRGEVAIINLSYLNQFRKAHPEQAARLLRADDWDQHYELRAMLSKQAAITPAQLEGWLIQLKRSGALTRLWTEYGVEHQAAP